LCCCLHLYHLSAFAPCKQRGIAFVILTLPSIFGIDTNQVSQIGNKIRLLQDTMNDDEQGGITSQNLQASTLMSSSIKLPQSFYSRLQQVGKPVFSWVVDSPLQLRSALSKNVDGIISNDPLFLKLVLKSWWKRCRSAQ
jgi:hypothetical protein